MLSVSISYLSADVHNLISASTDLKESSFCSMKALCNKCQCLWRGLYLLHLLLFLTWSQFERVHTNVNMSPEVSVSILLTRGSNILTVSKNVFLAWHKQSPSFWHLQPISWSLKPRNTSIQFGFFGKSIVENNLDSFLWHVPSNIFLIVGSRLYNNVK